MSLLACLEVQAVLPGHVTWALLLEITQGKGGDAGKKMGVKFPSLSWR